MLKLKPKQNGFAMIEVLVTAIIVAIGISGVGVLLLRSLQATQDNSQKSQAMWIVQDYVGRIRANSLAAKDYGYVASVSKANCSTEPAAICSAIEGKDAEACTSSQMASYDNWITICGLDNNSFDTPADFVVNPILESACTRKNGRQECIQYTIDLQWNTKLTTESSNAGERVNTNKYSMVMEVN